MGEERGTSDPSTETAHSSGMWASRSCTYLMNTHEASYCERYLLTLLYLPNLLLTEGSPIFNQNTAVSYVEEEEPLIRNPKTTPGWLTPTPAA